MDEEEGKAALTDTGNDLKGIKKLPHIYVYFNDLMKIISATWGFGQVKALTYNPSTHEIALPASALG